MLEEYELLNDELEKRNEELNKEIERLNNDIKVLLKENENKEKVIKIQDNIIKEVRECLNKNRVYITGERHLAFEIEEILDKE